MTELMSNSNVPHIQVRFFTKQKAYSVPNTPFSLPSSVKVEELSSLIKKLLQKEDEVLLFDFLVNGEFLCVPLEQHVKDHSIPTESVVDIEYLERHPAPKPVDTLQHDDWVSCLQAKGQHILSGSYDNTVRLWNISGQCLLTIPSHSAPVKSVRWIKNSDESNNPVTRFITASHDQTALIWEWNEESNSVICQNVCRGHAASVDGIAINHACTQFCTVSWDSLIKIWSTDPLENKSEEESTSVSKKKKTTGSKVPTKVPLMTLSGHKEGVSSCEWSSLNEIMTASWDHTIKLWDVEHATNKSTINGNKVFLDISYSPLNGCIVASSSDRHIRMYDPRTTDGMVVKSTFTSHTAWVSSVCWSVNNENQFISGAYDCLLKLWDTRSPKAPLYDMSGHDDKILGIDWTVPEYMLSGSADNHLKVFKYVEKNVKNE